MLTPTPLTTLLTAILCTAAAPLAAQPAAPAKVSHIYLGLEGGTGAPKRHVNIHEDGKVEIEGERCSGCRWHAPYRQKFEISAKDFQEIVRLFDVDTLQRAASAPCTMESAGRGRMQEYVTVSLDSGSRAFDFVQNCTSPELKIVRDRIAIANGILAKAAPEKAQRRW